MAIDTTVIVVVAIFAIVAFGVWLVLSGDFRLDRPGTTAGARWARSGRAGSIMSAPLVLLGFAGMVGLIALILGVLVAKY